MAAKKKASPKKAKRKAAKKKAVKKQRKVGGRTKAKKARRSLRLKAQQTNAGRPGSEEGQNALGTSSEIGSSSNSDSSGLNPNSVPGIDQDAKVSDEELNGLVDDGSEDLPDHLADDEDEGYF